MNQGPYGPHGPPPPPYNHPPPPPWPITHQSVVVNAAMQKPPFNHKPHLFLDVVTCGGWTPFHLLFWFLH